MAARIDLINPPALMAKLSYSTLSHPPAGLAYIAARLREDGHAVRIIDAIGEGMGRLERCTRFPDFIVQGMAVDQIIDNIHPESQIIAFSCMFTHSWPMARELITAVRHKCPAALLVCGGEHATAMYTLCLDEAPLDACVLGEGEETAVDLAAAVDKGDDWRQVPGIAFKDERTGKIYLSPGRDRLVDLDCLPLPAWDLVPLGAYTVYEGAAPGKTIPMMGSRGCPHKCSFCSAPAMWQGKWRSRDPRKIAAEMAGYAGEQAGVSFQFFDISPFISKQWIRELCAAIIEDVPGVDWEMPVGMRFDMFDDEIARLLVRAGCSRVQFAPESGSARVLARMNKKVDVSHFETCVKSALKADMTITVLFIIGYPGETFRDIMDTFRLIGRIAVLGVHEIAISSFVPIPGSAVFNELCRAGRIQITDDFLLGVAGATNLLKAVSWNPAFSGRQIIFWKLAGLFYFYFLSFSCRPIRLFRLLRNALTGRQQTKIDRALSEVIEKIKFLRSDRA